MIQHWIYEDGESCQHHVENERYPFQNAAWAPVRIRLRYAGKQTRGRQGFGEQALHLIGDARSEPGAHTKIGKYDPDRRKEGKWISRVSVDPSSRNPRQNIRCEPEQ